MEVEVACSTCRSENSDGFNTKCTKCKLIIVTTNRLSPIERTKIYLPENSIYFHLNEDVLHEYSKILHKRVNGHSKLTSSVDHADRYTNKNLLVIGCGGIKRMPVLLGILKLPFRRIVCLCNEKTWAHTFINDWILAEHEDISQKESTIKAIDNYMRENNMYFDTIITYDDLCTTLTSYLSELYGLNGISFDFCTKIKNKYEFRKLCKQQGISHPNFFKIDSNQRRDYIDYYKRKSSSSNQLHSMDQLTVCHFPVVVKNPFGLGKGKILS